MHLDGHRVRLLTAEDAPAVQALLELDPAYFELIDGVPLRPEEGLEIIVELPPGVPPERKHNFMIESPDLGDAVLLSLIEGFPDERTWYLGQIFVAPTARGRGLGTRALEALCTHARERGGAALRLAVVPANTGARRLYDRLGFTSVGRKPRQSWNGTVTEIEVLERALEARP